MRRINTQDGLYHNADPVAGAAGTIVTAEALNAIQEEIVAVITAAGITLDPADSAQLLAAIQAITGSGIAWGAITGKPTTFPPSAHTHTIADVNGLQDALSARPLQTAVTTQIAAAISGLIDGSPGALDTLNELSAALGDDANFAATVTNSLALKAPLNAPSFTGLVTCNGNISAIGWLQVQAGLRVITGNDSADHVAAIYGPTDAAKQISLVVANGAVVWDHAGWYGSGSFAWKIAGVTRMSLNNSGALSVASLAASGAITGASVRATGTIMAAGGFQIG